MDELLDGEDDGDWRPRRVATANTLALGDESREVTVRSFRTLKPFDKDRLVRNLRRGKLSDAAPIGVIHYLSDDADPDVRVVVARQGDSKLRRYDPDREEVDWWAMPRTILGVFAVRYAADEDGHLKFMMFGGGGIPRDMVDWFHETFAEVSKGEPQAISLPADMVRARCFDARFLDHLYAVQAQIDDEAHQTIDHTQFKSRDFIDPDCDAMAGLRNAEKLLIEAFDSEVTVSTPDFDEEVKLRFLLRTAAGSVRLSVPRLPFRQGLRDPSAVTRAFYDLCEHAVGEVVGAEAASLANLDPGSDDALFAELVDLKGFRRWFVNPGNRSRFFYAPNLGLSAGRWLPHLRALDEMLGEKSPPTDIGGLCKRLAREDPEDAFRLLRAVRGRGLTRIEALAVDAVVERYDTLPRQLYPIADAELLAVALADGKSAWKYDPEQDAISALGVHVHAALLPATELAPMLRRCALTEHSRILAEHPTAVDRRNLSATLTRLGECASPAFDDPAAHAIVGWVRGGASILRRLLGARALDDDEAAERMCKLFSLPLWPNLVIETADGGERQVRNSGWATALEVAVDNVALGSIPPGQVVVIPKENTGPVTFRGFGMVWRVGPTADESGPTDTKVSVGVHVARPELAAFRKRVDPDDSIRGETRALWQAIEDVYLASRHPGRPRAVFLGATGTGKSEFALLLHRAAELPREKFIRVGAGNFPDGGDDNIMRGELIGYGKEHGLKGITAGKKGYLQLAEGGSLFIDDFDGLPAKVQVLMLDILAGESVRTVSGDEIPVKCRVMLATNADLEDLVGRRTMRADLLQRVDVHVRLPALCERPTDVFHILNAPPTDAKPRPLRPSRRAWYALLKHTWPGNIRELRKCWSDAVVLAEAVGAKEVDIIHLRKLPEGLVSQVATLSEKDALCDVVAAAEKLARDEGFLPGKRGSGLWRRVHELTGIGISTLSRAMPAHDDEAIVA